jgi:hypothetical protein
VDQADIDENGSEFRLTSVEKQELAQLRREKQRLQTENEILKRAVADLARRNYSAASDPDNVEDPGSVEVDAASYFSLIPARAAAAGECAPAVQAARTTRPVPS